MEGQEVKTQVMASGDQIVIESPARQQASQTIKSATGRQEGQFERMLQVMRAWKNDIIVSIDNKFVEFGKRIMSRFNNRISVCKNRIDNVQTR